MMKNIKTKQMLNAHFVKLLTLMILLSPTLILAHSGEVHEEGKEVDTYSQFHVLNPIHYFEDQKWFTGAMVIVFWLALANGIYTLIMMIVGTHIVRNSKK